MGREDVLDVEDGACGECVLGDDSGDEMEESAKELKVEW